MQEHCLHTNELKRECHTCVYNRPPVDQIGMGDVWRRGLWVRKSRCWAARLWVTNARSVHDVSAPPIAAQLSETTQQAACRLPREKLAIYDHKPLEPLLYCRVASNSIKKEHICTWHHHWISWSNGCLDSGMLGVAKSFMDYKSKYNLGCSASWLVVCWRFG